jgi:capsular exopolysaccharide synthesis family protein
VQVELTDYLTIVRKRWVSIVLVTVLAVTGAIVVSLLVRPTYQATSQVFVSVTSVDTTSDLLQGSSYSQKQMASYTDLVTSPRVLIPVIEKLGLGVRPETLAQLVSADSPLNTVLINITVSDGQPTRARDIANAIADSLATQVAQLEAPSNGAVSPIKVSTVRTATVPLAPSSPKKTLNAALGLLIGLAVGFGVAILREVLDTKVRTEADVHRVTEASVIGSVHDDADAADHPLIVQTNAQSHRAESFRRLRTNLQFIDVAERPQTIVITSSLPGEGKSTTSINLAITLADAGSRVVLVDADLRRPSIAEYMGLEGSVGLTTVLIGRAALLDVVQPWGDGQLHVLPSGQVPPNPSELLGSRAMVALLAKLTQLYDVVLIDTPPLLPVTDAAILSRLTGGAVVVVGAGTLHRHQLAEAMGSLGTVGARVLGVVLNRLARTPSDAYAYYDYSTDSGATVSTRRSRTAAPTREAQRPPAHTGSRRVVPRTGQIRAVSATEAAPRGELDDPMGDLFPSTGPQRTSAWPGERMSGGTREDWSSHQG